MGLDMYLSAKQYLSKYSNAADSEKIAKINEIFNIKTEEDNEYGVKEVSFRVAYWRKANAIHQWFVDNVQDGVDECQESYVPREKLQELIKLCERIIADPKSSKDLLPTQNGFFFGSNQYDEWYINYINYTAKELNKALKDPAFTEAEFYYQASW